MPFPSSGDLSDPAIEPRSPTLAVRLFTTEPAGKPTNVYTQIRIYARVHACVHACVHVRIPKENIAGSIMVTLQVWFKYDSFATSFYAQHDL